MFSSRSKTKNIVGLSSILNLFGASRGSVTQHLSKIIGVVAFGGEPVSRSRSRSDSWSLSPKKMSKIELLQDSDDDHIETGRRKKTKEVVVTGGKALQKDKELWVLFHCVGSQV